jgi:hypothetical protein
MGKDRDHGVVDPFGRIYKGNGATFAGLANLPVDRVQTSSGKIIYFPK